MRCLVTIITGQLCVALAKNFSAGISLQFAMDVPSSLDFHTPCNIEDVVKARNEFLRINRTQASSVIVHQADVTPDSDKIDNVTNVNNIYKNINNIITKI